MPAITVLLNGIGDLEPDEDGVCQRMSAGLSFNAISAYFFE